MQGGYGRPVAAEEVFYSDVEVFCMKRLGAFSTVTKVGGLRILKQLLLPGCLHGSIHWDGHQWI